DVAEAVALLRAAHERAPNDGRIAGTYALALMRHQHLALLPRDVPARARAIAASVLERDASVTEAWIALGLVHLAEADVRSCAAHLSRALEIAPRNVDALFWAGNVLLECGRIDDALELFSASLAEDPDLRLVHGSVARAHALRRDW